MAATAFDAEIPGDDEGDRLDETAASSLDPTPSPSTSEGDHDQDSDQEPPGPAAGFTAWMLERTDHPDGRIGHLAQEIATDDKWPAQVETLDEALDYLQEQNAHREAEDALIFAWDIYERGDDAHRDDEAQLDLDAVSEWISEHYPRAGTEGVLNVVSTGNWTGRRFTRDQLSNLLAYVAELDKRQPEGIYIRCTTMRPDAAGRGEDEDSVELVDLWADIDIDGPGHKHDPAKHKGLTLLPDEDAALALVEAAGLPEPTVWIHSGGGLYPRWRLDWPLDLTEDPEDFQLAQQTSAKLQDLLVLAAKKDGHHYGPIGDLARVLRLPGTVNRKKGTTPRVCRVVRRGGPTYHLDHLAEIIDRELARLREETGDKPKDERKHERQETPIEGASTFDDFEARVDWSEILEPHGWEETSSDRNGTRYWRRPDKDTDGHSASTGHAEDRDRMWNWSTSAGLPVDEPILKPYVWAILNGYADENGEVDLKAAARALREQGFGPQDEDDDEQQPPGRQLSTLPDTFWTARPVLAKIREHAHRRVESADVVLYAILTRLSAMVPHTTRLDTGVGSERGASLNLYAIVVGPPGSGKTSGVAVAADYHAHPIGMDFADQLPLGSGEGIAEAFMGDETVETGDEYRSGPRKGEPKTKIVRKQVRHNAYFYADEGEALVKLLERAGATIGETLRRGFVGQTLGQQNANKDRTRIIESGTYSLGILIGFQVETALPLLRDAPAGTPQRFLWASALDPHIPEEMEDDPSPFTTVRAPVTVPTGIMPMADEIKAEIRRVRLERKQGKAEAGPLDGHDYLTCAKLAGLLAILDGRAEVNDEDWHLAQGMYEISSRVRDQVAYLGKEIEEMENQLRDDRRVLVEARAEVARSTAGPKVERLAANLARKVHDDGDHSHSQARKKLASRDRPMFGEAVDLAIARGWIKLDDEGRLTAGASKPAEDQ
jgi:hypothetical protein